MIESLRVTYHDDEDEDDNFHRAEEIHYLHTLTRKHGVKDSAEDNDSSGDASLSPI